MGGTSLSVVIPSYKDCERLLIALQSVYTSRWKPQAVFVIDNASNDGTPKRVQDAFPDAALHVNQSNQGFGIACNQGIRMARQQGHEYVLLLNQDARLNPDTIGSLVDLAQKEHRSAVVGCRTLSTTKYVDKSPMLLYNGAWRTILPTIQWIPGIEKSSVNINTNPRRVHYVWGHGMLLRLSALDQAGLFDPGFFMYYEDLDLCWRLEKAGWEIWCDSRAIIWHEMNDSARAENSQFPRWRYKARSARVFYHKHFTFPCSVALWLVASSIEWYWLIKKGQTKAVFHFAIATIYEICSATYSFLVASQTEN